MKKLSNPDAELKKALLIKKKRVLHFCSAAAQNINMCDHVTRWYFAWLVYIISLNTFPKFANKFASPR